MNHIKRIWSSIEDAYLKFHVWTIVETHAMRQRRNVLASLIARVEKLEAAEQERRSQR